MPETKLPSTNISSDPSVVASAAATAAKENTVITGGDKSTTQAADPIADKELDAAAADAASRKPIEDDAGIDFNEFLKAKDESPIREDAKAPEHKDKTEAEKAAKKTAETVEVKKQDKVETKVAPIIQDKPKTPTTAERDYTGFDEPTQKVLRAMSNEAFDYVRPKLLENQQLSNFIKDKDKMIADLKVGKQILPDSYYEHPQAFILTKDYNDNVSVLNKAYEIEKFWQEQFVKIRQGEDWISLDGIDKDGNLVVNRTPIKGNAQSEASVMGYMNAAAQQVAERRAAALAIQHSFRQRHEQSVSVLKDAEKKHFAAYEDPKHPYAPVMKTIRDNIPTELRGSPLTSLLVKSSTAVIQLGHLVKQLQTENAELKAKGNGTVTIPAKTQSDKAAAGPTEADTTIATSGGKGKTETAGDDFNDFLKFKAAE